MAKCFCGCGEEVGGLADRGINKQGHRTVELLGQLEFLREQVGELDSVGCLDSLIQEGEEYRDDWAAILHTGATPPRSEAKRFKKEWEAWGKRGMILSSALQKDGVAMSAKKAMIRVMLLKDSVEERLAVLGNSEARPAGQEVFDRLEPLSELKLPENPEPAYIQRTLIAADLWLMATSDDWRYGRS